MSHLLRGALFATSLFAAMGAVSSARAADVLVLCAYEGQTCITPNDRTAVSYGKNGAVVTIVGVTQIGCDNGSFKQDPLVGQNKVCTYTINPDTVNWVQCAQENGSCSFTGAKLVRYGSTKWTYSSFVNGVSCNNGVFGDPERGANKLCQVGN